MSDFREVVQQLRNPKQSTTSLYDADGEVRVGDVVRYGGRPCYIERWDGTLVWVTTMDEKKLFIRLWPRQLGLVVVENGGA